MEIIKPLSEDLHSMVRSGIIINCLTTVVEELIYNSLDAGATKVLVSVAVNNGYVKVEDDGSGISREGLVLLGERYATSKCPHLHEEKDNVKSFGFRGEVLCSIADISLVEIVTRIHGRPNGYRKVMKGRKCLCLSVDNDRQDVGTTVTVRDLFYNQPVRRRQMQCSAKKILHEVKKCTVWIALVQPKTSFKVMDMESEDELLCTRSCPTPLSLLCSNFGIEASCLHELSFSEGLFKLTGYVSAVSSTFSSKAVQYIYINSRIVVKGPIHKVLNRLADMYHDQLRGNRGEKRGQLHGGLFYCLNLTCPCYLYDLNLEISRASVEFKDWAPVLSFVEKSVMSLWSEETRRGISHNQDADRIRKHGMEKVGVKSSLVEKDSWLRTCEMSTKRRRIQNSENQQACSKESLGMKVKDCNNLSLWTNICREHMISERISVNLRESDSERESARKMEFIGQDDVSHSNCILGVTNCFGIDLLQSNEELQNIDILNNNICFESDDITMEREPNHMNSLSNSRWKDEVSVDDSLVESSEMSSIYSFEMMPENGMSRVNDNQMDFHLQSGFWKSPLEASLYCDKEYQFQIANFKNKQNYNNFLFLGDADSVSPNIFHRAPCQIDLANMTPLLKSKIASHTKKDSYIHMECDDLFPSCEGSFDVGSPLESPSVHRTSLFLCSPANYVQQSEITYPSLRLKDWDFHKCIHNGRSRGRDSSSVEKSNHEEEELYCDGFRDRSIDKNFAVSSCLNSTSLFTSELPGFDRVKWIYSPQRHNFDDITSKAHCDTLFDDIVSTSMDRRHRNSSVCLSPLTSFNKGIQIDLKLCQEFGQDELHSENPGLNYDSSDNLMTTGCDSLVNNEAFSPCQDSERDIYIPYKSSLCLFSPISTDKTPTPDSGRCQVLDPNCSSLEVGSCVRSRRSQSAPPFYRGKKTYLSVKSSLFSATEKFALETTPRYSSVSERSKLKHPFRPAHSSSVNHQQDGMRIGEDSLLYVEPKEKKSSKAMQVSAWSLDGNPEPACFSNDYLKLAQDSESSRSKWREGCPDAESKEISNYLKAGDRRNDVKDGNEIMDIQSCMLDNSGSSLVPKSISRKGLENAKVLWQIDNKFIPVVANGTLAVIDQHAADERIRLEEMRQKVLSGEMKSISYLEKERDLVLPEMVYQLLCNYAEHLKHWGWICNIFSQDSSCFAKNLNLLNERASHLTLIAVPCILGVNLSDTDLVEFLEQLADTDGSSTIPLSVARVLNYKACRGAIMFGDKLLPSECSLIVEELKQTSLCFQCAHGRPTTVPLVNLNALHTRILQLGSWSDLSKNTWRGLCRKEISLDRAKRRLDAARGSE
ncbi:unnamed protein product [Amaranthus hypochondriacus]